MHCVWSLGIYKLALPPRSTLLQQAPKPIASGNVGRFSWPSARAKQQWGCHAVPRVYAAAPPAELPVGLSMGLHMGAVNPADETGFNLAAIDIGTNSFHMVVVRATAEGRFEVIDQMKETVRLLEGSYDYNVITPEAAARALDVLRRFHQVAHTRGAAVRAVATSAVREAKNGRAFVQQILEREALSVEVVPGWEEARLVYLGVLQALPVRDKLALVLDIGGGSMEIVLGQAGQPLVAASLRLGHLALLHHCLPSLAASGEVVAAEVQDCRRYIRAKLADSGVVADVREFCAGRAIEVAVGTSGTVETCAEMILAAENGSKALGEDERNAAQHFSAGQLRKLVARLLGAKGRAGRLKLAGLAEKRADLVVPGAIVLEEVVAALGLRELQVSQYALREGVIADSLARVLPSYQAADDIRRASAAHLAQRFSVAHRHESAQHSARLALRLLAGLKALGPQPAAVAQLTDNDAQLLEAAAVLHNVGMFVSHTGHHKHSYYIIRNSELLLGFKPQEVELVALMARHHRKKPPSAKRHEEIARLPAPAQRSLRALTAILRLAVALDRRCTARAVAAVDVEQVDGRLQLRVRAAVDDDTGKPWDVSLELWAARQELEFFEKVMGRPTVIIEMPQQAAAALS